MATSQNGFPASEDRNAIGVKTFVVPGYPAVSLPVRADIAPLLLAMARWWFDNIEKPVIPGSWGYAARNIRGSSTTLSNHASGTAIDLNAPEHPMGKVGTVPASKRKAISAKAKSLGLRWGGDYSGRVDEMHFEVNVSPERARQLVAALQGGKTPPAPPVPPPAARPLLRQGDRNAMVKTLQAALNRHGAKLAVDGIFGRATLAAVRAFQSSKHLVVDGLVGKNTWKALG